MSALYQMRYEGVAGVGHGAVFIGKGKILGIDVTGARYEGTYASDGDHLRGAATMVSAGGALVTGQEVPPGTKVQIVFDLPANATQGQFRLMIASHPMLVALDKIGDVP